jgi:nucleoside-diphosphate-sugar epimerase
VRVHDLRQPLPDLPPPDWVFHLAGAYAGAGAETFRRADLLFAQHLAAWGLRHGVRNWVLASAAEVYGDIEGVADEDAPLRPVIPYGEAKLEMERAFLALAGMRVVVLRIGEVYGAGCRLIRELRTRLDGRFCPWPGDGRTPCSFVHVDDVAQAFVRASEAAPEGVSVYNVADDEPATWREFTQALTGMLGVRPPVALPWVAARAYAAAVALADRLREREPTLTRHALRLLATPKAMSNARLRRELGFRPRFPDYRQGLEQALYGISNDGEDGPAQSGAAHQAAGHRHPAVC